MEVGFIEVFPARAAGSRSPTLLQTLETELLDSQHAATRAACAWPHQQRDAHLADNLCLHTHRKVFQSFIEGFGAKYRPLLQKIKRSYEAAIESGVRDALQNCELRQQLLDARQCHARAEASVRAEVIDAQQPQREELYRATAAAQARLAAALRRQKLADRDLERSRTELERLRGLAKSRRATKQRLLEAVAAEPEWQAGMLALTAGPLSPQEDEELEAEMGVALCKQSATHPLLQALQLLEKHDAAAAAKMLEQHTGASNPGAAQPRPG